MVDTRKFSRLTPGVHAAPGPQIADVPQVGRVVEVTAKGAWVTVPAFPSLRFGPCPWTIGPYSSLATARTAGFCPDPGDSCLLVWAGNGVAQPVVAAWWR